MSCCVGCRHSSDLVLLWLWCRPASTALIRPQAWEPPYATSVALKRQKTKQTTVLVLVCQGLHELPWLPLSLSFPDSFHSCSPAHLLFFCRPSSLLQSGLCTFLLLLSRMLFIKVACSLTSWVSSRINSCNISSPQYSLFPLPALLLLTALTTTLHLLSCPSSTLECHKL